MTFLPGTHLGRYEIAGRIGSGGMGVVYRARDAQLKRDVALKVLPPELASERDRLRRFELEAQAASALSHPNIIHIYEFGEAEGTTFIAMEYVQGDSLRRVLDAGPLTRENFLDVALQICEGLARAHQAGLVHRDLKPDNIVIGDDGFVKILDFGLAKREVERGGTPGSETNVRDSTAPGAVVGTARYMSPEQARGWRVDARSDIFSLGAVMYEMAFGVKAFDGPSAADVVSRILHDHPPGLGPDAGDPLAVVLTRCMEKDRRDRFQLVADVAQGLRQLSSSPLEPTEVMRPIEPESSIAVLPFADMSAEKELDYLCEGMAEEILNALTKVDGLRVACRTSSFLFKERAEDARQIGAALNVRTLLQGSVRSAAGRLRVTVQLVDCASGFQRWSERYDRELGDLFELEDDITSSVVEELIGHLEPRSGPAELERRHGGADAYHLYLKGRYFWHKRHLGGTEKAVEFFEKAIEERPDYALAYAGLAEAHAALGIYGFVPPAAARRTAREFAEKALELDETLAEAHRAVGFINLYYEWNWTRAEGELRKAIELNPSLIDAHSYYAVLLAITGRHEEAALESERAVALDPYSADARYLYAVARVFSRDYEAVRDATARAAELEPNLLVAWIVYGLAALQLGDVDGALQTEARLSGQDNALFVGARGVLYGRTGREEEARDCLRGLEERSAAGEYVPAIFRAWILAALDEADEAIAAVKDAVAERHPYLVYARTDMLGSLQDDPRLPAILSRVGSAP